ncbi:MAG: hypothetical protein SGJ10_11390 [Bacteroidota bacterium]|nr:hypothetical protein [Bacteroidota bacterium]
MKNIYLTPLCFVGIYISSCKNTESDKAKDAVKTYLKTNLKHAESYGFVSFATMDTLKPDDTLYKNSVYSIKHIYIQH